MPIAERSESTQVRAKREEFKAEKRVEKLINPAILLAFKQTLLPWASPLIRQREPALAPTLAPEEVDDSAEELLLDALIGEACGDNNIIEELITIQQVFDSVQGLLSDVKQLYTLRTFSDLLLLKQYTAQILKKDKFFLDKFAASRLVA